MSLMRTCGIVVLLACVPTLADPVVTLPGTRPLTEAGDLSKKMLDGLHRFAERKIVESVKTRAKLWMASTSVIFMMGPRHETLVRQAHQHAPGPARQSPHRTGRLLAGHNGIP
jgi:hypothetical protein